MNLDIYTEEMAKSIWDKAFFLDKIPGAKCVIDFGCADASLICMAGELFPSIDFYGYDINTELLKKGLEKISQAPLNVKSIYDGAGLTDLITRVKRTYKPEQICINFSSVLHEVFSSSQSGKATIKRLVSELKPKYITIRDMYFHESHRLGMRYVQGPVDRLEEKCQPYLKDFEAIYGSTKQAKNLIHFLMKYQWKDNGWDTELNENYFAWDIDDDFMPLVDFDYTVVFENYYQLPFLTESWKDMFYIPNLHTHAQFILRRD